MGKKIKGGGIKKVVELKIGFKKGKKTKPEKIGKIWINN